MKTFLTQLFNTVQVAYANQIIRIKANLFRAAVLKYLTQLPEAGAIVVPTFIFSHCNPRKILSITFMIDFSPKEQVLTPQGFNDLESVRKAVMEINHEVSRLNCWHGRTLSYHYGMLDELALTYVAAYMSLKC